MANYTAAGAEIRAAKKFLDRKGFSPDEISPRKFAMAAKELDCGFKDTLGYLAKGYINDDKGTSEVNQEED